MGGSTSDLGNTVTGGLLGSALGGGTAVGPYAGTLLGGSAGGSSVLGGLGSIFTGKAPSTIFGQQHGGVAGSGIEGPIKAPIQDVTTPDAVKQAQTGTNNSLDSQNKLLQALQAQRGLAAQNQALGNQAYTSNQLTGANGAGYQLSSLAQQQGLNNQLQAANGVGQQQQALGAQQALSGQLANVNGAGQQQLALANQQRLQNQLAGTNGVGTQNQAIAGLQGVAGQQQNTAGMYQNIAEGRGPNPAQAALNQSTGQNVQNQAALMASQRGAGSNVGLLARQAAQQGAATQQQAVGQGASMQAQQQMNALAGLSQNQQAQAATQQAVGGLGTTQLGAQQAAIAQQAQQAQAATAQQQAAVAQQAQQGAALTGAQQQGLGAYGNQANQLTGNTIAAQQAASGMSNTIAGQQIGATQTNTQANLANAAQQQAALGGMNNANVSAQGSVNAANVGLATPIIQGNQGISGGMMNAGGAGLGMLAAMMAKGGDVQHFDGGGDVEQATPHTPTTEQVSGPTVDPFGPSSSFGKFLSGWRGGFQNQGQGGGPFGAPANNPGAQALNQGVTSLGTGLAKLIGGSGGSSAPASTGIDASNSSPGMGFGSGGGTMMSAHGGLAGNGGKVYAEKPSQKAEKKGDSYDNDKVPAMLSEGEIVVPRSITQGQNPERSAADFVAKVLAKRRAKAS